MIILSELDSKWFSSQISKILIYTIWNIFEFKLGY